MRLAVRLYSLAINLLPRDLRERFSAEMVELFEKRISRAPSWPGRLRVLAGGLADVLAQAVAARTSKRGDSYRGDRSDRDRGSNGGMMMGEMWRDVRYAGRGLRKAPSQLRQAATAHPNEHQSFGEALPG